MHWVFSAHIARRRGWLAFTNDDAASRKVGGDMYNVFLFFFSREPNHKAQDRRDIGGAKPLKA